MDTNECLFCKIAKGELPSTKLYEDDTIVAFEDKFPIAPVHFLVIPKEHVETLDDVREEHSEVLAHMLLKGAELAREKGVAENGYRQVINCGEQAGQVVFHLHLHIIGGRQMEKMG